MGSRPRALLRGRRLGRRFGHFPAAKRMLHAVGGLLGKFDRIRERCGHRTDLPRHAGQRLFQHAGFDGFILRQRVRRGIREKLRNLCLFFCHIGFVVLSVLLEPGLNELFDPGWRLLAVPLDGCGDAVDLRIKVFDTLPERDIYGILGEI